LHATTTIFTPFDTRNAALFREYATTVLPDLVPYGTLAVSPRYIMSSPGSLAAISLTTVSPPIPESNTPIGALLSLFVMDYPCGWFLPD